MVHTLAEWRKHETRWDNHSCFPTNGVLRRFPETTSVSTVRYLVDISLFQMIGPTLIDLITLT